MTPTETVLLTEYVRACCPQQAIGEYTPDAWHDLLDDLSLADCREAVRNVARRQPFVAPAEIRAEVRKIREDRLARTPLPAPPAALADDPERYREALAANVARVADGMTVRRALAGPLPGDPPAEWRKAKEAITPPEQVKRDPREVAREQVEAARAKREGAEPEQEAS